MQKLKDLKAQFDAIYQKMKIEGQEALKEAFMEFFEKHPQATSVLWTQYSPHFADGDPCVFGVNEFQLELDDNFYEGQELFEDTWMEEISARSEGKRNPWSNTNKAPLAPADPRDEAMLTDLGELETSCRGLEMMMELVFGNGYLITATREGFSIEEYDHD